MGGREGRKEDQGRRMGVEGGSKSEEERRKSETRVIHLSPLTSTFMYQYLRSHLNSTYVFFTVEILHCDYQKGIVFSMILSLNNLSNIFLKKDIWPT